MIHNVRSETLYNSPFVLKGFKTDVNKICDWEISRGQSEMIKRGQGLKTLMDRVLLDEINKHRCLKQKITMAQCITWLQIYEHRYEQLAYRHIKFLRFIKNDTPNLTQHCRLSLSQEFNMEDLVELLTNNKINVGGKRRHRTENELLLTLLPSTILLKSTTVKDVYGCSHISCVTPNRVWISGCNLISTDITTGDKLYSVKNSLRTVDSYGLHTVNSECELIYIDEDKNINKLSSNMKTTTTFIKKPETPWRPRCVYCSPSSGDLLVGMFNVDTETFALTGEVRRYNNTGKVTQTIPHDNTSHTLYEVPNYITENNNGDIVVSDYPLFVDDLYRAAVVVTDRRGRHRFSYKGPYSSGSGIRPLGICTDVMSHILVCDDNTRTVQMISKDGEFLSYLLTMETNKLPLSLSYDVNTHLLWVGLWRDSTVTVYRYINRHLAITEVFDDVSVSHSSPSRSIPGYSQEEYGFYCVKEKTRIAAETAEKRAAYARTKATKAAEATENTTEGTDENIAAESAAREAAEKAETEAAAARAAANAAAVAKTIEAAEEATKAEEEAAKATKEATREAARKAAIAAKAAKRRANRKAKKHSN